MDELFDSGITLAYLPEYKFIFENGDETEFSEVKKKIVWFVHRMVFAKI
jgi:hypothetical protein